MPKQKTHKGAAKRFKITGSGKVSRHHATKGHMLTKKTAKQKRGLRHDTLVKGAFEKTIKGLLHTDV
ncbi:MAG TPA: 50S ribosomal protein L35 [Thermoanaerobaculia bacterium]|nr:50S ribosomal protein L35 [Thermoanaerobaculia bacterium]